MTICFSKSNLVRSVKACHNSQSSHVGWLLLPFLLTQVSVAAKSILVAKGACVLLFLMVYQLALDEKRIFIILCSI